LISERGRVNRKGLPDFALRPEDGHGGGGRRVETLRTDWLEEAHGINDWADLERAQRLKDIPSP
jgi:hypothetical protein